jgi:hypothetical protein
MLLERPSRTVTLPGESEFFSRHGYVSINRPVAATSAVLEVRRILEQILNSFEALPQRWRSELGLGLEGARIHEVQYVAKLAPELRETELFATMYRVSQELLGVERLRLHFDHMITKPGGSSARTAWHQDVAFDPDFDCPMTTMWVPLQAVDQHNGCMHFVSTIDCPDVLEHVRQGVDGRGVEAPPIANEVACPLPLGGMTAHGARTLHGAGPNQSDASRIAWIVKFVADERNPVRQKAAEAAHARYWKSVVRRPLTERFDVDFGREY